MFSSLYFVSWPFCYAFVFMLQLPIVPYHIANVFDWRKLFCCSQQKIVVQKWFVWVKNAWNLWNGNQIFPCVIWAKFSCNCHSISSIKRMILGCFGWWNFDCSTVVGKKWGLTAVEISSEPTGKIVFALAWLWQLS